MKYTFSEYYRKYLIRLSISGINYLTIWGTDMEDEIDKLIVDNKGKIIVFSDYFTLKRQLLLNTDLLFDRNNFLTWLNKSESSNVYATYNLESLLVLSNIKINILEIRNHHLLIDIINILNLIGDYAYQIKETNAIIILEDDNILLFKDYVYTLFIWNSTEEQISKIKALIKKEFSETLLIQQIKFLYKFFTSMILE